MNPSTPGCLSADIIVFARLPELRDVRYDVRSLVGSCHHLTFTHHVDSLNIKDSGHRSSECVLIVAPTVFRTLGAWLYYSASTTSTQAMISFKQYATALIGLAQIATASNITALLSQLSPAAEVFYPYATNWTDTTQRWTTYEEPTFFASIKPNTTLDVQRIVG